MKKPTITKELNKIIKEIEIKEKLYKETYHIVKIKELKNEQKH